ncbi:MAG TPA: LLM class flavin-dependent oxidoreductase [Myxococcales bacterium]|nr:LLM class flavin-dependent oxidoreductase [Myxococcales bacterium]
MEVGLFTFAECGSSLARKRTISPSLRLRNLVEEITLADQVGLDWFGVGEHHRADYAASSPAMALAGAATQTSRIRLSSAVTVLGSSNPVHVFQEFSTLDNLSGGRAEIMVGRGAFVESFPLFGLDRKHYESLFSEKLALLMELNKPELLAWPGGQHTAPVRGCRAYPRPVQSALPIWLGSGGTPSSVERAAKLGLPLAIGIIGGDTGRFKPLLEGYRRGWEEAGHAQPLQAALTVHGFVAASDREAGDIYSGPHNEVMTRLGAERGWPPATRAGFDAQTGPTGAFFVGSPSRLVDKILAHREAFGVTRIALQMGVGLVEHRDLLRAIELLGTQVAPEVRRHGGQQ